MGESRGSSESRSYSTPSYSRPSRKSSSSESRGYSSESRDGLSYQDWLNTDPWIARGGLSSQGEMRQAYNEWVKEQKGKGRRTKSSSSYGSSQPATKKYNSIDDVDKLIKKLEGTKEVESNSPAVNAALEAKRKKLEELKALVAQAKAAEAEKKLLDAIQRDSEELDKAIKGLKGRSK
ncbi:MAG: hypothetical protein II625_06325 [Bacilli bacterium]|nr:hypothetical protein [Bacilli bacterium]